MNGVRTPVRLVNPKGGGLTPDVLRVRVALVEDEGPQPPSTGGRGAPYPTAKSEPSGEERPAPSNPSAGGANNSSENAKKRRLNWHCLGAAGVEVKFPEEGAAPRMRIWFSGSP